MPPALRDVRTTPAAQDDLVEIWIYTAAEWGELQADYYLDELDAAVQQLRLNPHIAPECPEIREHYRKQTAGRHRIYYRIEQAYIEIVRVIHVSRDAPALFED